MSPSTVARLRGAGVLLALVGAILLMPPVVTLFVSPVRIAGVPLAVAYLFGVWAALIAGAFILARRLRPPGPLEPAPPEPAPRR